MYNNKFNYYMPTEILFGDGILKANSGKFKGYSNIFIVTGKSSAKKSGALYDVLDIIGENMANFLIFDEITENPLLSTCYKGGQAAAEFGADLIIGIGGGSPIDAAKSIAMFAANKDLQPEQLFTPPYENHSIPIFAIPTTAGTGTEVNPYAIMTLDNQDKKKTFSYPDSYPKTAFLDSAYTNSLSYNITVSTALDALCHCIESLFSPKSNEFSIANALIGMQSLYPVLKLLTDKNAEITKKMRDELLFGALCGGFSINVTGTGFPHPMGYNLTLMNGLPHGTACAVFINEYVTMQKQFINSQNNPKFDKTLALFEKVIDSDYSCFKSVIDSLVFFDEKFDDETIESYVKKINDAKNFQNSLCPLPLSEIITVYKKLLQQ